MLFLSIVIPAYNEENRIGKTLAQTLGYFDPQNYECEVLTIKWNDLLGRYDSALASRLGEVTNR